MSAHHRIIVVGNGLEADRFASAYRGHGATASACPPSVLSDGRDGLEALMPAAFLHVLHEPEAGMQDVLRLARCHGFPLGLSLDAGSNISSYEPLVMAAEAQGVPVMEVFPPLYSEPFQRLLHFVRTGFVGTVNKVCTRLPAATQRSRDKGQDSPRRWLFVGLAYAAMVTEEPILWGPDESSFETPGPDAVLWGRSGRGTCLAEVCVSEDADTFQFEVRGSANCLVLTARGSQQTISVRRNGSSRVLSTYGDVDTHRDAARCVLRYATDRTGYVANGHVGLVIRQTIQAAQARLGELLEADARQIRRVLEHHRDAVMEVEVFERVPIAQGPAASSARPFLETKINIEERCNQHCEFCFVPEEHATARNLDDVMGLLLYLRTQGIEGLVLSGGEPTLNPHVLSLLSAARKAGFRKITLETNGTALTSLDVARQFHKAGMDAAFVSLHSHRDKTAARITGTTNASSIALAAIASMLDAGITVDVNCVVNRLNFVELPSLVEYVARHVPGVASMTLSFVAPLGRARGNFDIVPRISEAAPFISEALLRAEAAGLTALVPGRCGIPLCFLPGMERFFVDYRLKRRSQFSPTCANRDRVKPQFCASCTMDRCCQGLWAGYAEMFGTGELHPLTAETVS
jgi:MoaA/NifB/PqqE/SkfB family radical SAM enzyme